MVVKIFYDKNNKNGKNEAENREKRSFVNISNISMYAYKQCMYIFTKFVWVVRFSIIHAANVLPPPTYNLFENIYLPLLF